MQLMLVLPLLLVAALPACDDEIVEDAIPKRADAGTPPDSGGPAPQMDAGTSAEDEVDAPAE
jgi:hypothetical protein